MTGISSKKTLLRVRVTPNSAFNQVTGWHEGVLGLKLTARPVEGAANKACLEFLSQLLHVRKSHIRLVKGETSRNKIFEIAGISEEELHARLSDS